MLFKKKEKMCADQNQLTHSGKCKLKCPCPKSLFFKNSLAGASVQVLLLLSVPEQICLKIGI